MYYRTEDLQNLDLALINEQLFDGISERELEEMYDEFLNECYPVVKIGYSEFDAARILKELDPTAYRCGFSDWLDSQVSDDCLDCIEDRYYFNHEVAQFMKI